MPEMTPFELKPISREAIPNALEKAMRYRLLNESLQAESICRDILEAEPENQQALTTLILALTDQFVDQIAQPFELAREMIESLKTEYERFYYLGIIYERRGHAHRLTGGPGSGSVAYQWYRGAMEHYEQAEKLRPTANDDAILRWNSCARVLMRFPDLGPPDITDETPLQLE